MICNRLGLLFLLLLSEPHPSRSKKIILVQVDVYLQSRDAGGVGRECGGAQVASQQGVQGRRHRGVGRFPVCLEILGEMFTGVLQLVFIQDDVKHFLLAAEDT